MTAVLEPPQRVAAERPLTVVDLWEGLVGSPPTATMLAWPPDVAVLTSAVVERAQIFRFALSPPEGHTWPPATEVPWSSAVAAAADAWVEAVGTDGDGLPALVADCWRTVLGLADTPIEDLASGRPWALCAALLTLHAVADEACAGGASWGDGPAHAGGVVFLGRARELLARRGSLASLPRDRARLLPRVRTATSGITHRSLSRYSCVRTDGMHVTWHKTALRRPGGAPFRHANLLLLPWPLVVRERDFHPVPGSIRRPDREPFGLFEFVPSESTDLALVDRLLAAARDEVDHVDAVVLPEGAVGEDELAGLEEVLARHRTPLLIAGTRAAPRSPDRCGGNVVHVGALVAGRWWHYRQSKHHRWYLEANQISQYHLGGALHPGVRWWEAMEIPERSVQFLELGDGITIATVICEDLARLDGVADLLRAVGPTLVFVLLLDGPQISGRWTARYATVLADDPGSTVLTLTAHGMVRRSQPPGCAPSRAVALWKAATAGPREIDLEPGACGVLVTTALDRATRYVADGRAPADDGTELVLAGLHPVHDVPTTRPSAPDGRRTSRATDLGTEDLSVLVGWSETLADAIVIGAPAVKAVVAAMLPDAPWRAARGLDRPARPLAVALQALADLAASTVGRAGTALCASSVLEALDQGHDTDLDGVDRLARRVLHNALGTACARRGPGRGAAAVRSAGVAR